MGATPVARNNICPQCNEALHRMDVRDRKYWYCQSETCSGQFHGRELSAPLCPTFGCNEPMILQPGTRGRWVGRWFWSCRLTDCSVSATKGGFAYYNVADPLIERQRWRG